MNILGQSENYMVTVRLGNHASSFYSDPEYLTPNITNIKGKADGY